MTIHRWLCGAALAAMVAAPAGARAQQTPEQVVQAYYQHLRAGDTWQVAALTHPQALEDFKAFFLELMSAGAGADVPFTREALQAMPADSAYAVFMAGVGEGMSSEELRSLLTELEIEVVGQVPRGDSTTYVVYEATSGFMGAKSRQTMVVTLRRAGSEWRVDPGEGVMSMMGAGVFNLMMGAAMQAGFAEAMLGKAK